MYFRCHECWCVFRVDTDTDTSTKVDPKTVEARLDIRIGVGLCVPCFRQQLKDGGY